MLIWGSRDHHDAGGEGEIMGDPRTHAQTLKPLSTLSFCRSPTLTGHSWRGSNRERKPAAGEWLSAPPSTNERQSRIPRMGHEVCRARPRPLRCQ
jgi:hypothetical protein